MPAHLPLLRGPALAARRLLVLGALAAAVAAAVAACGAEPGGTVTAGEAAAAITTTTVRTVPTATDGALRTHVPAVDTPPSAPGEVLLFGDSVALLLADDLAAALPAPLTVDAVDCRRLDSGFRGPCGGVPAGVSVASGLDDLVATAGDLDRPADTVAIVVVANNAALAPADVDEAMAALADVPRVWWVTARVGGRAWQDPNNRLLAELAEREPRAAVIDWFAASEGQDWLADHVHPDDDGQAALAELVAAHVTCDCTP